jgi:4-amino-4-deoxy-L-arabinose transferase-like glycosyltransferase
VLGLLASTAVLYLWGLGRSGWANAYYSAAVQAGAQSWKAFFFGSFDASNFITVDKSPAFLWPMELSARVFGLSSWSVLVPQALEGVAAVGLLYLAVRRWSGPAAGLLAGLVLALTPVAALMFRFDNPDALLTLLFVAGAYAVIRAVEHGSTRWLVLAGTIVGFAFLAKMLQSLLVVPAFALVYLVAAPGSPLRRIRQLLLAGVAMVVAAGWWVAVVELWPKGSRPFIGGSQTNSVLELMFGYNGFGRLTGDETGSVGAGPQGTNGRWGPTGLGRLFNSSFGGQISWLLPAALVLAVVLLAVTFRRPRTDRTRAAAILWGGWLLVTGLALSLAQGIIHPYYTVALGPPIGALVGIGTVALWARRQAPWARFSLAGVVGLTAWWASRLLERTPRWHAGLSTVVLVLGISAAVLIAASAWSRPPAAAAVAAAALAATLLGPVTYTWATVQTPHAGALPIAGPAVTAGLGPGATAPGRFVLPGGNGGRRIPFGRGGGLPGVPFGGAPGNRRGGGSLGGGGGGIGGILNATTPSPALTAKLDQDAGAYQWVAAVVSANQAAGYQLATDRPVMAIGGFNGTDPAPTLAQFQRLVEEGRVHWFVAQGRGFGPVGADTAASIPSWVERNYRPQVVDGTTIYDLSPRGVTQV